MEGSYFAPPVKLNPGLGTGSFFEIYMEIVDCARCRYPEINAVRSHFYVAYFASYFYLLHDLLDYRCTIDARWKNNDGNGFLFFSFVPEAEKLPPAVI